MSRILSIGNFDGVHRGHRALIARLVELKKTEASEGILSVLTFEPHPIEVLRPGVEVERLTPPELKEKFLKSLGVEEVIVQPFDHALAAMSPGDFFQKILVDQLGAQHIVVGENFRFGAGQKGDSRRLEELGRAQKIGVHIVPKFTDGIDTVSSSRIRRALTNGEIRSAQTMLGRPYRLVGSIVTGAQKGRTIGVPTANLETTKSCKKCCIPKAGVYVTETFLDGSEKSLRSVTNVGFRPTVDAKSTRLSIETHVLSPLGDLYGKTMSVDFIDRIRDEIRFPSLEALKEQIQRDIDFARSYVHEK